MIRYDPNTKYKSKRDGAKNTVCLRDLSIDKLNDLLKEVYKHRHELRFQQKIAEDISPHMWKKMQKEIAKIKTILREIQ